MYLQCCAFLSLCSHLCNPTTLKSIDYNVAMTFIHNNNNNSQVNHLESSGNYSATSNTGNMKLVYWTLMGGLLHLVQ